MVDKVLKAILLLSPIFYVRDIPINNCDFLFFHFAVIALVIASMFDVAKCAMVGRTYLASLLGLCLFSVLTHKFNVMVSNYAVNVFFAITALTIIVTYCKDYKSCYKYIVYAGLINIGVYLFQRIGFSPVLQISDGASMGGIFGNRPRLSMYLCILIPFFYDKSRWLLIPLLVAMVAMGANEFNMMLAFLLFLLMSDTSFVFKYLAIVASIGAVVVLRNHFISALQFRGVVLGQALTSFFNAPLYGLGLGVYPLGLEQMTTSKVDYAIYSSVLQFIICGGLLAIPLVYEGARRFVRHFSNSVSCKSLAILAVLCLYEYPLEITRLWITIIAIIGFFIIQTIKNPVIQQKGKKYTICEYSA